ncbi:hypothetical protein KoPa5_00206 [Pseudomonas phage vB_PpuM-KoPa-5]
MKTEQEMQRAKVSHSMAALLNDAVGGSIGPSLRDLGNAVMGKPKHKRKVMNRSIKRVNAIVSKHGVCPKVLAPVRFVSSKKDVFKLAKIK